MISWRLYLQRLWALVSTHRHCEERPKILDSEFPIWRGSMSSLQFKERRLYCVDLTIYWDDIPFSINLTKRETNLKAAIKKIKNGILRGGLKKKRVGKSARETDTLMYKQRVVNVLFEGHYANKQRNDSWRLIQGSTLKLSFLFHHNKKYYIQPNLT